MRTVVSHIYDRRAYGVMTVNLTSFDGGAGETSFAPLQSAHRQNLGVEDVIMLQRNTFKSAFSTIQLLLSRETLKEMSLNMYMILWITVHMTDRLQHMRLGSALSDMTICSTVTPPGLCCLHSCLPCTPQTFNTVYRRTLMVLQRLDVYVINKTTEMVINFKVKRRATHLSILGQDVDVVGGPQVSRLSSSSCIQKLGSFNVCTKC